ncbi:MAG: phytanoyl-CoA dioxygenase family protein [Pseudomonadota bacterium]
MSNVDATPVSELDTYLFDLQGYLLLRHALTPTEVAELNAALDPMTSLKAGERYGQVYAHTYGTNDGLNLTQIYEAGEPFEKLIDHPAWIEHMKLFIGGEGTFDHHHGPLFIDECFAHLRGPGEAIGLHSGGYPPIHRNQFRYHGGRFMCGQVNVLVALTPIGPGDGGTMVIPGSHKSNFRHPQMAEHGMRPGTSVDGVINAIDIQMDAGDALVFVDSITHGSARRTNPGTRRVIIFRYGPSWGNFRLPFRPSKELLDRLTPFRRKIVQPMDPIVDR